MLPKVPIRGFVGDFESPMVLDGNQSVQPKRKDIRLRGIVPAWAGSRMWKMDRRHEISSQLVNVDP